MRASGRGKIGDVELDIDQAIHKAESRAKGQRQSKNLPEVLEVKGVPSAADHESPV